MEDPFRLSSVDGGESSDPSLQSTTGPRGGGTAVGADPLAADPLVLPEAHGGMVLPAVQAGKDVWPSTSTLRFGSSSIPLSLHSRSPRSKEVKPMSGCVR